MKLLFVLFLAIASACGSALKSTHDFRTPMHPIFAPAEGRITNGKTASITEFPYQAGVQNGNSWCGGAVLSTTSILTAAHCVDGASPSNVIIYVGSATRTGGTKRTASSIRIHTGWNPRTLLNDIAIVKFSSALSLSSSVAVVNMPSTSSYAGSIAAASGWGKTSDTSSVASTLQYIDAPVITNTECQKTFGSTCSSSNICISTAGGKSTCNGDSGGPLVIKGTRTLIGLTSYGSASGCTAGYPAAFTRVSSYLTWISQNK